MLKSKKEYPDFAWDETICMIIILGGDMDNIIFPFEEIVGRSRRGVKED